MPFLLLGHPTQPHHEDLWQTSYYEMFRTIIEQLRTHDFKECFGVHALSRSKVGPSLLQGAHRGTYAVNSSDT